MGGKAKINRLTALFMAAVMVFGLFAGLPGMKMNVFAVNGKLMIQNTGYEWSEWILFEIEPKFPNELKRQYYDGEIFEIPEIILTGRYCNINSGNFEMIEREITSGYTIDPPNGTVLHCPIGEESVMYFVAVTYEDGSDCCTSYLYITVYPKVEYGDIDGDGDIVPADLVRLSRHIAEIEPINEPALLEAADVTGDKKVSIADLIRLARFIAGQDKIPLGELINS